MSQPQCRAKNPDKCYKHGNRSEAALAKKDINAYIEAKEESDKLMGKEHNVEASWNEEYFVFLEDATSPIYGNITLEEARAQAEIHSSIRTDGKVYIVSKFDKTGHRDKDFETHERSDAEEISSKINIKEPQRLVGQAIGKLATAETDESFKIPEAIKTLTLALRDMKDLVVFRPVQFKEQILLAHSVMDDSFFNNK